VRALELALGLVVAAAPAQVSRQLAAQDVAARLAGRVPATVARVVEGLAQSAAARGLPVEPLIQKAIEGGAKGAPADRVIRAVRLLVARLDEARSALREAGIPSPSAEALEGGADALNAGLSARQVRDLGRVSRPQYDPALTLSVAASLAALGVPAERGLRLVTHIIQAGRGPNDLLDLPSEVQVGMARGATAAEAAEELEGAQGPQGQQGQQNQQGQQGQARPRKP
jgi:hypothetical protein